MAEDVKPEVIKRTQESLGKYIKKPPMTEKLLKKPPFRFLHDIVTSVIRDTGFLQGLLTKEELNHENIKDRESKVAFLQKVIDAVKTITGTNLTVRPTKIVAGHEATKTNEFLQAIGNALDNKLSSADYITQLQKDKGAKAKVSSSKDESSKSKASTSKATTQARGPSQDRNRTKDVTKKKSSSEVTKRSKASTEKKPEEEQGSSVNNSATVEATSEQQVQSKLSTSQSERHKSDDTPQVEKSKSDSSEQEKPKVDSSERGKRRSAAPKPEKSKPDSSQPEEGSEKHKLDSSHRDKLKSATSIKHGPDVSVPDIEAQSKMQQEVLQSKELEAGNVQEEAPVKEPEVRPRTAHENRRKSAKLKSARGSKPESSVAVQDKSGDLTGPLRAVLGPSLEEPIVLRSGESPSVPVSRPKSVRPKSARPPHPRPKSRIEVLTAVETGEGEGKVKVITENEPLQEQDEDDGFVVAEAPPALIEDTPPIPTSTAQILQSGEDGQHGHLVAQILETQKELEDDAQRSLPHQDTLNKRVEIEWDDAGRQRERELVSKEVERLRASIQTLTRAANPLGKLMDFLQEDVDTMQNELRSWRLTHNDLRKQLLAEERQTEVSIQPLKLRLQELNEKIEQKLDEISAVKARIMENENRIRINATASSEIDPDTEGKLKELELKYSS